MARPSLEQREARTQGLASLVRLLMARLAAAEGRSKGDPRGDARGGAGQIYVNNDATIDESVTPGFRYPLHRLSREPTLRELAAREKERVARLFPKR